MKTLVRARHLPGFAALALVLVLTGAELTKPAAAAEDLDRLLAPIALYPDQLLAQMLMCASDSAKVKELHAWLKKNASLKGTPLQDAAVKAGFDPSYVALTLFPDIVNMMAVQVDWTTRLGKAFAADRAAVFDTIQRLRAQAQQAGTLKSTPQQEVQTQTTSGGQNVIVIEPTNPQVIYVPQYNPQTVYTTNTVVVEQQSSTSSSDAAVAGLIGFTAGIAIGAAMDNDYYYGPYGWRGGAYMYNDAWDDYYDHREDARDDWQDHREDLADERGERAGDAQEQRTERRENQSQQRTDRTQARQENRPESAQRSANAQAASGTRSQTATSGTRTQTASAGTQTASAGTRSSGSYESRGRSTSASTQSAARQRSGTSSDAFSGYSSGKSTRASSARGQSSRGGSRSGGGGRRR